MIVKIVQDEAHQNVLLVVHDETGQAHDVIEKVLIYLQDLTIYNQIGRIPDDLSTKYFGESKREIPMPKMQNNGS